MMSQELTHEQRIEREASWHENHGLAVHPLNQYPLYSPLRNHLAYEIARQKLAAAVAGFVPSARDVLIAPCGYGADALPFRFVWRDARFVGLDISSLAVEQCQLREAYRGDILAMPFPPASFDVVISALFFHHVADEGYAPYLQEIRRVLQPGGSLVTLEPSAHHPLFLLTRPLRKLTGNITPQVEHEHPISIPALARACTKNGFVRVETFACSFGHNRMPTPVTCVANALCRIRSLRYLSWLCGLVATVPSS